MIYTSIRTCTWIFLLFVNLCNINNALYPLRSIAFNNKINIIKLKDNSFIRLKSLQIEQINDITDSKSIQVFDVDVETLIQNTSIHPNNRTLPIHFKNNNINILVDNYNLPLLSGVQALDRIDFDDSGKGMFVSFDMKANRALHDISLGSLISGKILSFSRIKRWWQAPQFCDSVDDMTVETQFLLVEISTKVNGQKIYAVIIPLIDYDSGFRCTFYGCKGESLIGSGKLGCRFESGDQNVRSSYINDGIYVAAGYDPYVIIETAYEATAHRMGTFRTMKHKPLPSGLDYFGWCSWDAFYSSVDPLKVEQAVQSLIDVKIPPKFVIIDDGWQSTAIVSSKNSENPIIANQPVEVNSPTTIIVSDGQLSGAQIDGNIASKQFKNSNILLSILTKAVSDFYINTVEKSSHDSWPVQVWSMLSQTILKEKLIDFFNSQTDFSKRLVSWKANSKFEDHKKGTSLKSFIKKLKSTYKIEKVMFWHALSLYWGGVSENMSDEITSALSKDTEIIHKSKKSVEKTFASPTPHLLQIEPALNWDPSALAGVGSVAIHKLDEMYKLIHTYLVDSGADGVKVDAQSAIGSFGNGRGGGSAIAQACVHAMEKSVRSAFNPVLSSIKTSNQLHSNSSSLWKKTSRSISKFLWKVTPFKGRLGSLFKSVSSDALSLEGCMCHSTENLYNFYETSIVRASDDFYPRDIASQTVHIVSCAFNSVMLSEFAVADWDMFHSKHPYASMHASARAISGGPVYVSDSIGNHDENILRKIVFHDGLILRTLVSARPTIDSLFTNPMLVGKSSLKIFSENKVNHVIGVFNVQGATWDRKLRRYESQDKQPNRISASVKAADIPKYLYTNNNLSYVAWSSLNKEFYHLSTKLSTCNIVLDPAESDIITVSPILRLFCSKKPSLFKKLWPFSINTDQLDVLNCIDVAPIGLVDMFNAGGSVEEIHAIDKTKSLKILAKGIGKFGIYTNKVPKIISVDGVTVVYDQVSNHLTDDYSHLSSDIGKLITFELKNKDEKISSLSLKNILVKW